MALLRKMCFGKEEHNVDIACGERSEEEEN